MRVNLKLFLFLILVLVALISLPRRAKIKNVEAGAYKALSLARTPEELDEAVGWLGVVLRPRDGSWIAIHYRDSHAFPTWSLSVARDSGGKWFRSQEHFCGNFQYFRSRRENPEMIGESSQLQTQLQSIDSAKDLETARLLLLSMGFEPMDAPSGDGEQ